MDESPPPKCAHLYPYVDDPLAVQCGELVQEVVGDDHVQTFDYLLGLLTCSTPGPHSVPLKGSAMEHVACSGYQNNLRACTLSGPWAFNAIVTHRLTYKLQVTAHNTLCQNVAVHEMEVQGNTGGSAQTVFGDVWDWHGIR